MTTTAALLESIAPALADYEQAIAAHRRDWDVEGVTCSCGWSYSQPSQRSANRALSLHVTAAHKRAGRIYDADAARLMAAARDA